MTIKLNPAALVILALASLSALTLVACSSGTDAIGSSSSASALPTVTVTATPSPTPSSSVKTVEVPVVVKTRTKTVTAPRPVIQTVIVQQPAPVAATHRCRDLFNQGYTWNEMMDRWYGLGSPPDMDIDHNDWPCETVYGPYYNHVR